MTAVNPCYLDHNASTPLRPGAASALVAALGDCGNPSSVHGQGRAARRRLDAAREQVAALAGARAEQIVFTSGGTEANNLALRGCNRRRVLVSAIEHDSVLRAVDDSLIVPVGADGIVDLDALSELLDGEGPASVVSIMLANNETGIVQPVAEAAALARSRGALLHCDAIQTPGRIALDFTALGVDMLSLSAHKLGGPKGVGALIVADRVDLRPILRGGGQERGRRAGTENVPGIAGFGAAAAEAVADLVMTGTIARLRDALEARIAAEIPTARIVGQDRARLPNTTCLALPGIPAETQVMALDLDGIAVSAGSACSSGKVRSSHVLRAMHLPPDIAGTAIRVSLGPVNTQADIDRFLAAYARLAARAAA